MSKATLINSYIHTLIAVAAMQGANQHIRGVFQKASFVKNEYVNPEMRETEFSGPEREVI